MVSQDERLLRYYATVIRTELKRESATFAAIACYLMSRSDVYMPEMNEGRRMILALQALSRASVVITVL